mgnify:CR=1 FL=1|tara:strand:- start:13381 stop:14490 length:1110 start_codon:yes stop_codon:yes gene_type:complete
MWKTSVLIHPNDTINGNIQHQILVKDTSEYDYSTKTSSAGLKGPKHNHMEDFCSYEYGTAGQDVFGHSQNAIFVADGHGQNGQQSALDAIEMHKYALCEPENLISQSPREIENNIRQKLTQYMSQTTHTHSGATFACMAILKHNKQRWAITTNIGDSEALLIYNNRIHTCSVAHVWDDLDLYNKYVKNVDRPRNVCYNRWNASKHRLKDSNGEYRPIMIYDIDYEKKHASVHQPNLDWVSNMHIRFSKPSVRFGTQSIRLFPHMYQNWGSSVMINGVAKGQNMATYGDSVERSHTKVPLDMIHVYIHQIESDERVVGIVQTDGVSNRRTLNECYLHGYSKRNAESYLENIENVKDDMAAGMIISEPITE